MENKEVITLTKQLDCKVGGVANPLVATDYKEPQVVMYVQKIKQESYLATTTIKSAH